MAPYAPYYSTTTTASPVVWASTSYVLGNWPVAANVKVAPDPFDRAAFARLKLASALRPTVEPPRPLAALALERRPELVRRAPRPAGRPYGWRRARKAGRRT